MLVVGALLVAALAPMRPAEAAGSASISGVVTDRGGQPVAGVTVQLSGGQPDVLTDGEGRFVAEGLPAGQYAVCFLPADQVLEGECWRDVEMGQGYTPLAVGDGEQVTGIDAELLPTIRLSGTVTNERGEPIEGALVSTTWYPTDDSMHWGEPILTAADGSYVTDPLPSGEHTLRFSDTWSNRYATEWWEDAPTLAASTRIHVERGESVDHLDAVLADLAHISGRVRGADGASAAGTTVRVFRLTSSHSYSEVGSGHGLGAGGRFDIAVQPGTYRLAFEAAPGRYRTEYWTNGRSLDSADDVVITGTMSVTDLDADLQLAPPVQLTRRPTISGHARVGKRLTVGPGERDVPSLRFTYQWRADGSVIAGATGRKLLLTPSLRGQRITARVTATATAVERSPGSAVTERTGIVRR